MRLATTLTFFLCFSGLPAVAFAQEGDIEQAIEIAKRTVEVASLGSVPDKIVARSSNKSQIGWTISGGVSLGIYQAGFMYLLAEAVKENSNVLELKVATGASAGSANALMSVMTACSKPNPFPEQDLAFKVWVDVGYEDLFQPDKVSELAMFTRDPTTHASENIWEIWKGGLSEECDVVMGVSATRSQAEQIEIAPGLLVPSLTEKFTIRIRGRGYGVPPEVTNYVDFHSRLSKPLLPLKQGRDVATARQNFEVVSQTLNASMAFPVAFLPQNIKYCRTRALTSPEITPGPFRCTETTEDADFVDGGVFDNNPLRLAHEMERLGLRADADGGVHWRDAKLAPEADVLPRFNGVSYIYVDPDTLAYPTPVEEPPKKHLELISTATRLAGDFIETARARELYSLMSDDADLRHRMRLTKNHFPTASEHLNAFMGLFERDFRVFDYYLGMYDASAALREYAERAHRPLSFKETVPSHLEQVPEHWKPFACMFGYFEPGKEKLRSACEGKQLRNFRILLQVSLDRLFSRCSKLKLERLEGVNHPLCLRAARGQSPPRVAGVRSLQKPRDWQIGAGEDEFDQAMRLMAYYQFEYKDLGLTAKQADKGRVVIRRKLLKMIEYLANAQPTRTDRTAVLTLGRSMINNIEYEPPVDWFYGTIGTALELGVSTMPTETTPSWLRLNMAMSFKNLFSFLSLQPSEIQISPKIGTEWQVLWLASPFLQPMIGIRGGYQLSSRDLFHFESCDEDSVGGDKRLCSQPIADAYLAVAVIERLRFQMTLEVFPLGFEFDNKSVELLFGLGGQFF